MSQAMAPPLTLTRSMPSPSCAAEWIATEANASLISTKSNWSTRHPAVLSALVMARAGLSGSEVSGPAVCPQAPSAARIFRPRSSA